MKIKVTADSTCDLSPELIAKYQISIVPLSVQIGDQSFKDGLDIQAEDIVSAFEKSKDLAKTSAVSMGEYYDFFTPFVTSGEHVVHISIGKKFSACYQNACVVANDLQNVTVIDSENLSTGQGHVVIRAAQLAAKGATPQEIHQALLAFTSQINASFLLNTLVYLHKGGRCSAVAALGSNLLKLKPCIEVKEGKMGVGKKYRGELAKCYEQYVAERLKNIETLERELIFITHSPGCEEIIPIVKTAIENYHYFENIIVTKAGSTITSHCGPGTLGMLYIRKQA